MADDGQMILLSAIVACLCLICVVACVVAVEDAPRAESGYLSSDTVENIRWAQDSALEDTARHSPECPWQSRGDGAIGFMKDANSSVGGLSIGLLKRGVAYEFAYNDSLAGEYAAVRPGVESIRGVLVERVNGSARVRGCAYDLALDDGFSRYRMSRVFVYA